MRIPLRTRVTAFAVALAVVGTGVGISLPAMAADESAIALVAPEAVTPTVAAEEPAAEAPATVEPAAAEASKLDVPDESQDGQATSRAKSPAKSFTTLVAEAEAPKVIGITQTYQASPGPRVTVELTFDEPVTINLPNQGWYGAGAVWHKAYYSSKPVSISFVDEELNLGEYSFTVDADAPKVVDVQQVYETKEGGRVSVTLTFDEDLAPGSLKPNQGWNGSGKVFTKAFYRTKDHQLNFTDIYGNPGSYLLKVVYTVPPVVVPAPSAPAAISPQGWQQSSDAFTWSPSTGVNAPLTYTLITGNHPNVDSEGRLTSGVIELGTGIVGTSFSHTLAPGPIFWQVQAKDSLGNLSAWSSVAPAQIIGAPQIVSPATGLNFKASTLKVTWTDVFGIGGVKEWEYDYFLDRDHDSTFEHEQRYVPGSAFVSGGTVSRTQQFTTNYQGDLFIKVRAIYNIPFSPHDASSDKGPWSNVIKVTRDSVGPVGPQPVNPENGRMQSDSTPTFVWNSVTDAVSYQVRASSGPSRVPNTVNGQLVNPNIANNIAVTGSSYTLPALGEGWIWWQVRGVDALGNLGQWSNIWATGVDVTKPTIAITSPAAGTSVKPGSTVTVTVDAADNLGLKRIAANLHAPGGAFVTSVGSTPANSSLNSTAATRTWSFTVPANAATGEYSIRAGAVDAAGHNFTTSITLVVDGTRPTVAISSPLAGTIYQPGDTVTVTVDSADPYKLNRVVANFYEGTSTFVKAIGSTSPTIPLGTVSSTKSWSFVIPADAAAGDYSIRASATDLAGNNRTVSILIEVELPLVPASPASSPGDTTTSGAGAAGTGNAGTGQAAGDDAEGQQQTLALTEEKSSSSDSTDKSSTAASSTGAAGDNTSSTNSVAWWVWLVAAIIAAFLLLLALLLFRRRQAEV